MKQSEKQGKRNKIGAIGEQITVNHLKKRGYSILDTNYLKKWGEIDVVAHETLSGKGIIHFIEVKTVSYETKDLLQKAVSYGTWRPEENVHAEKMRRLQLTIESWILEKGDSVTEWQIDIAAVRIVPREKYATIKYIDNVIFG